jgi:hypothetical protein
MAIAKVIIGLAKRANATLLPAAALFGAAFYELYKFLS